MRPRLNEKPMAGTLRSCLQGEEASLKSEGPGDRQTKQSLPWLEEKARIGAQIDKNKFLTWLLVQLKING